jgi:citrate lyase subunit gamma (acyl carrier protein)
MKIGIAGSLESNDCLITIQENETLEVTVTSIVDRFYHDQIVQLITDTLTSMELTHLKVTCQDKGALDYTIKARLLTALHRMEATHA